VLVLGALQATALLVPPLLLPVVWEVSEDPTSPLTQFAAVASIDAA
jgi:hypothetical protein